MQRADLEFKTIPRMMELAGARFGSKPALIERDVQLSYADIRDGMYRAARALMSLGVERGDRVAIWASNTWEWIVAALGLQAAGASLIPINTRFKGAEAAYLLEKSRARVLFTMTDFLDTNHLEMLRATGIELPDLKTVVVNRGRGPDDTLGFAEFIERGEEISMEQAASRLASVQPDDISDILFSSGTTGRPKGAMCTHAQSLRAYWDWGRRVRLSDEDRYLIMMPFFHAFGYKAGWLASFMTGCTIYPESVLDVERILERIEEESITVLPGPPTLYQTLLSFPNRGDRDLSSLRLAVTGAAVIPDGLVARMREELGFESVLTGYGLTEACGIVTGCDADDPPEIVESSSGYAYPGVEVAVMGSEGVEVPRGELGEVWLRGYSVMKGYLDAPDETAATVDADGWLHTGDIGQMDARGYLRVTDRIKDMFLVGGFNAYPAEIENLLLDHEGVEQVAVVGMADERLGEVGAAFVVARRGASPSESELIAWSREHMANYKVPRRFVIVETLPLNASGKVLKTELRARLRER